MKTRRDLPLVFLFLSAAAATIASGPRFASGQSAPAESPAAEAPSPTPTPLTPAAMALRTTRLHAGQQDYERWCQWCHGREGDGRGISARRFDPHPRDFTEANFKCRTTPSGSLPTDADLKKILSTGVHASAMPGWTELGDMQIDDLVEWVKHYSDRFATELVPPPVVVPPETPSTPESIARGAVTYTKLGCIACHGKALHGNGTSSRAQKDDDGFPLVVADLARPNSKKCGDSPARIYTTLMTGLNGTPMPSFADGLTPEQAWDLVHFIRSREETAVSPHP